MMAKRLGYSAPLRGPIRSSRGPTAPGGSAPGPHRLDPWRRSPAPRSTAPGDVAGTAYPFPRDESGHRRSASGVSFMRGDKAAIGIDQIRRVRDRGEHVPRGAPDAPQFGATLGDRADGLARLAAAL